MAPTTNTHPYLDYVKVSASTGDAGSEARCQTAGQGEIREYPQIRNSPRGPRPLNWGF